MTPKEKSKNLVNSYRIILMNEDTECGNEILCTSIAKQCALIAVDEILYVLNEIDSTEQWNASWFYNDVKQEIQKL